MEMEPKKETPQSEECDPSVEMGNAIAALIGVLLDCVHDSACMSQKSADVAHKAHMSGKEGLANTARNVVVRGLHLRQVALNVLVLLDDLVDAHNAEVEAVGELTKLAKPQGDDEEPFN